MSLGIVNNIMKVDQSCEDKESMLLRMVNTNMKKVEQPCPPYKKNTKTLLLSFKLSKDFKIKTSFYVQTFIV
jgi:hypothetical protein